MKRKLNLTQTRPELVKEVSPKETRDLTKLTDGSGVYLLWECPTCHHEWEARINHRANKGTGCPVCAGKVIKKGFNDLATTYPDLAKEVSKKNQLKASEISAGQRNKMLWECSTCHHEWEATVLARAITATKCPKCSKVKEVTRHLPSY